MSISETLFALSLYSIYWPAVRLGNKVIINSLAQWSERWNI